MRRTTIYFAPELEVLLKLETLRQKRPMAEIVREAVEAYLTREPQQAPPGAGAFASGVTDTAARADEILRETGFGATSAAQGQSDGRPRRKSRRPSRSARASHTATRGKTRA